MGSETQNSAVVTLIEPGAEPLRTLRLSMPNGSAGEIAMTWEYSALQVHDGTAAPPQTVPGWRWILKSNAVGPNENGDISCDFEIVSVSLLKNEGFPEDRLAAMRQIYDSMRGVRGSQIISDRGWVRELAFEPHPGSSSMVRATLNSMSLPLGQTVPALPDEPIGVGGSWKVQQPVVHGEIPLAQTTTYAVTKLDEHSLTVEFSVVETAPSMVLTRKGLPAGAVRLIDFTGTGTGSLQLDLNQVLPSKYTFDSMRKQTVQFNLSDRVVEVVRTDTGKVTIGEPIPAPEPPATQPETPIQPE